MCLLAALAGWPHKQGLFLIRKSVGASPGQKKECNNVVAVRPCSTVWLHTHTAHMYLHVWNFQYIFCKTNTYFVRN